LDCLAAAETVREPGQRLRLLNVAQLFLRLSMHVRDRLDRLECGAQHLLANKPTDQGMQDAT
jgi:hypothetical protein